MRTIIGFMLATVALTSIQARLVRTWTHEELAKAADLIVIIEATAASKASTPWSGEAYGHKVEDFQAWATSFKVHTTFKGTVDADKPLQVLHYSYSHQIGIANNGADFASFATGPMEREIVILKNGERSGHTTAFQYHPVWLAYLKKGANGQYVPVTGQYDSQPSFKELSDTRLH